MNRSKRAPARLAALLLVLPAIAAAAAEHAPQAPAFVPGDALQKLLPPQVVLLDARPFRDFLAGHLPGAQSVTPDNLRSTSGGVPVALYPPEVLGAILARAGVDRASHVVVYGNESDADAAYVATAVKVAGAARVSVLDGGFARWAVEGRPVTSERVRSPRAKAARRGDGSLVVSLEEALKHVGDGKTVFLDVRSEEQWLAGRIPGARNRSWKKDVEGGSLRPAESIRAEMEAVGVSWERPVVVYCNSGHQASEAFWVLRYLLGHPDTRLYEGSWLEWSMTPEAPRVSGASAERK